MPGPLTVDDHLVRKIHEEEIDKWASIWEADNTPSSQMETMYVLPIPDLIDIGDLKLSPKEISDYVVGGSDVGLTIRQKIFEKQKESPAWGDPREIKSSMSSVGEIRAQGMSIPVSTDSIIRAMLIASTYYGIAGLYGGDLVKEGGD